MTPLILRADKYGAVTGGLVLLLELVVESGTALDEPENSPLGG